MEIIYKTPSDKHYFFGYYDKSPLNKDNSKILACRPTFIERMPSSNDLLEIGYFDWKNSDEFIKLTETKTWNWQQGCMLQWLPPIHDEKIIYNDLVNNKFVTVIFNTKTKIKTILPMAYYTISNNGEYAFCIDFERHYWFRSGYNYQGIENKSKKKKIDHQDGIWKLELKTNKLKQILKMSDILEKKPLSNMLAASHYIEHLMVSPNSKRLSFLHRWQIEGGGIFSRLYTINIDGSDINLVSDSGRMSHFCWRNERELLAYGGQKNLLNSLRKFKYFSKYFFKFLLPLYNLLLSNNSKIRLKLTGDNYLLFEDKSNSVKKVDSNLLTEDGHPSFNPNNQDIFVSDTYEQKDNHRELFLFDLNKKIKILIDRLYSTPKFNNSPIRCDLHPKWSRDGKYISIDTINNGTRGIYVYSVNKFIK